MALARHRQSSERLDRAARDGLRPPAHSTPPLDGVIDSLKRFTDFGTPTRVEPFPDPSVDLPVMINEFWTAKQRAAHSLHEISYRACFKPQLPRFFIERLSAPGDVVYDPFMGRGTTLLEAGLLGRLPYGCDINPLSCVVLPPRFHPPALDAVTGRLAAIPLSEPTEVRAELLAFYHPQTLVHITNLRRYLLERESTGQADSIDRWIRMVATNRLTGHSPGFFSVYTLPPNQALSVESQLKINERRGQIPPERNVVEIVARKTRSLLADVAPSSLPALDAVFSAAKVLTGDCRHTPEIADASVTLVVTSPPFLDVVDYKRDNWLRCWFNGIDADAVPVWQIRRQDEWQARMSELFHELRRVLVPGGCVAFEVGEVRGGTVFLETLVVPAALDAGLTPRFVLINDQQFTKTANCWGVSNRAKGTNTNRVVVLQRSCPDS